MKYESKGIKSCAKTQGRIGPNTQAKPSNNPKQTIPKGCQDIRQYGQIKGRVKIKPIPNRRDETNTNLGDQDPGDKLTSDRPQAPGTQGKSSQ